MQNQFINRNAHQIVPGIQPLLERFDWVFASRLLPQAGGPIHRWKGYLPKPVDDPGSALALDYGVRPPKELDSSKKTGFGAITAGVRTELQALGIRVAHVCGMDTDLCVLRTVGDLMELGIRPGRIH
ncbi:MAG: isochorismatase family protein [Candidatus Synoicihabitans palmerolidicus]|nr:isochorismatase family protein [Candidatus Synoicihabitans palmerolidicus]